MGKIIKRCPHYKECLHYKEGCTDIIDGTCVRFMPKDNLNYVKIGGIVELPPHIDVEMFDQYFLNWIESMGWYFGGMLTNCDENGDDIKKTPFIEGLFKDE